MEIEVIDKNGVDFALGAVVCERPESICSLEGDSDLKRVPQVKEDVVPVFMLFANARYQGVSWHGCAKAAILFLHKTLREPFCMKRKKSVGKAVSESICGCDAQ